MAKQSGKKKTIMILAIVVAAIFVVCFAGIMAYSAQGQRVEAERLAARQVVTNAALEAAEKPVRLTRSAEKVSPSDLEHEGSDSLAQTEDDNTADESVPESIQEYAPQQPPAQESYTAPATAPAADPVPEASPTPPAAPSQTWVVTKAAWTEQVAVYGTIETAICNGCGADITGFGPTAHAKSVSEEAKMNGCGAWHTQYSEGITGYKEVYHPEEGYWQ